MGQHVTVCRVDVDGLHVKKVGTFSAGQLFAVEAIPPELIEKVKRGETGPNKKGLQVPLCSFMTPTGAWIPFEEAYLAHWGLGKAPPELVAYEASKKSREPVADPAPKAPPADEEPAEVAAPEVSEAESEPEVVKKKKPKIVKG